MSMSSEFYFGHSATSTIVPLHANFPGQRATSWNEGDSSDVGMISAFVGNRRADHSGVPSSLPYLVPSSRRKRQRNCILDESSLDDLAERHGYTKIKISLATAPLASYRRGVCRLNFWLTTGNVGSYLDHPTKGKHLLVRRDINLSEAESVFQNPMHHIGREYRRTTN
eukprot:CAMPEP_0116139522 /NCGR_PEP_ID=MMETSP0329-20121206/13358_1 /TAXON_ID=697910 /ORGANISM="Pseudo-nitzschia arenysensis, Strain B593" /LENGTH=167 /DNA_ID=CAMNT_0003634573 /DNA_START=27 /DNA_END=530 /DNA_ORIENTATION=-